jgi:ubiquinone/menaquinone biosynthesis C-methylase UbiE
MAAPAPVRRFSEVLEVGVGTGRNLPHYPPCVAHLTALDFSPAMLQHARRRARGAICPVLFVQDDVCTNVLDGLD